MCEINKKKLCEIKLRKITESGLKLSNNRPKQEN